MSTTAQRLSDLATLHHRRYGVIPAKGASYAQAASVCLSRHHTPPAEVTVSAEGNEDGVYLVDWPPPSPRERAAWANDEDSTRDGAYSVALAATEAHLGLVAVGRAKVGTGADYYVGPPGTGVRTADGELDLEEATRLDMSGIDSEEASFG